MKVKHLMEEKSLIFEFDEEIDHHNSLRLRKRTDYEIERFMPKKVVLDFKDVKFMDSAGIGFVLGRYNLAQNYGGKLEVQNINKKIENVFQMSGMLKIIDVNQTENQK